MGLTRVVIKYDLSTKIPKNSIILNASLGIYFFGSFQGTGEALAFRVTTGWNETATPDWKKGWKKAGGDFDSSKVEGSVKVPGTGWRIINLKVAAIQDFVNNPSTNYGHILIPSGDPGVERFGGQIYLSEAASTMAWGNPAYAQYCPKLTVTYQPGSDITIQNNKTYKDNAINIITRPGFLQIKGVQGNLIKNICVYSIKGELVGTYNHIPVTGNVSMPFRENGFFVVSIKSLTATIHKAVVIK